VEDYTGSNTPPPTNAPPIGPIPPTPSNKPVNDNADGHAGAFP